MKLWKKRYTLRRYEQQRIVSGYAANSYKELDVYLNIQPVTENQNTLPEGRRKSKVIKSFGAFPIKTADQFNGIPADRVLFEGLWYECTSVSKWEHTPLAHYEAEFTIISEGEVTENDNRRIEEDNI